MKILSLLPFEWRWQMGRPTFFGWALVMMGLAAVMVRQGYGPDAVYVNSPYSVMQALGLFSLWAVFVQTLLCVNGALRDVEHHMVELILSRPVTRFQVLASRFLGIFTSGGVVLLGVVGVMMVSPPLLVTDPSRLGPISPLPYTWAFATLVLPNLLLISAFLFGIATFTQSTLATYVGGITFFALYMVTALLVDSPLMAGTRPPTTDALARAAILDPLGLSAFFEQARYWTPSERNQLWVQLQGHYLVNRILVVSLSGLLLGAVYRWAPLFQGIGSAPARVRRGEETTFPPPGAYHPTTPAAPAFSHFLTSLTSTLRLELRHVFGAWPFQILLLLWLFVAAMEVGSALGAGEYGTRILATSGLIVTLLTQPLTLLGTVCLVYFSAELAWREQILGIDPLIDATPASNGVFYLAKLLTLMMIPMILALSGLGVGAVIQGISGGLPLEVGVYLSHLWFAAYPLVVWVVPLFTLHLLSPNRWVGMMGGLLLVILSRGNFLEYLAHPLFRFGATPPVSYSDLNHFGPAATSFAAFMGLWTLAAALLILLGWGLWRRGCDPGILHRLKYLPRVLGMRGQAGVGVLTCLFTLSWLALFYHTRILHPWQTASESSLWRVQYEQTYRHLDNLPQPTLVSADVEVGLYPEEQRATLRGKLALQNQHDQPLSTVWITTRRDVEKAQIQLDNTRQTHFDPRYGMWEMILEQPLAPGQTLTLTYRYDLDRSGVRAEDFRQDVTTNGSYLTSNILVPSLGYRASYEETDELIRQRHGLGPNSSRVEAETQGEEFSGEGQRRSRDGAWITLKLQVSTAGDQTAIGPGQLVRSWQQAGRQFFEYRVDTPMTPVFAVASGRYQVKRVTRGGVEIEMWHHPTHDHNVDTLLKAAAQTLEVLGSRLGPYPLTTLRMVEIPRGWPFGAFATTGVLFFTEDRGMLADTQPGQVDLVTRRVAHEVAHQWWGHRVDPVGPGAAMVVESLAKYAEQRVLAHLQGEDALPPMLVFDHDRYLAGRALASGVERPLVEVADEPWLYYGKGALALNALHHILGEDTLNRVLSHLVTTEGGPHGRATAARLHTLLRAEAQTPQAKAQVDEWLKGTILYDLKVQSATAHPTEGGYHLEAHIQVDRLEWQGGAEQTTPADGAVMEVQVRGQTHDEEILLYRGPHPVVAGVISLALDLDQQPTSVEIDPGVLYIDRDRSNNIRAVEVGP